MSNLRNQFQSFIVLIILLITLRLKKNQFIIFLLFSSQALADPWISFLQGFLQGSVENMEKNTDSKEADSSVDEE